MQICWNIVARIEKKQARGNVNKEIITIFEPKINNKIASVQSELNLKLSKKYVYT